MFDKLSAEELVVLLFLFLVFGFISIAPAVLREDYKKGATRKDHKNGAVFWK